MNRYEEIEQFISEDKIEKALAELDAMIKEGEYRQELIQFKNRYAALEKDRRSDVVSDNTYKVDRNKFVRDLLSLVSELEGKKSPARLTEDLSHEAKELLKRVADDLGGLIRVIGTKDGWSIQLARDVVVTFGQGEDPRAQARWESAIDQLCQAGCIKDLEPTQRGSKRYKITAKGYNQVG